MRLIMTFIWIKRDLCFKNWDLLMLNSPLKKVACSELLLKRNVQHIHIPQQQLRKNNYYQNLETQGDDILDETFNPPSMSTSGHNTINLSFATQDLLRNSAEEALRLGLSRHNHVMMTSKFVKMGGGSLKDVSLSVSTSHRQRKSRVMSTTNDIKSQFKDMLQFVVLHWDSKLILVLGTEHTEDRRCAIASFPESKRNIQFLSSPLIRRMKW